MSAFKLTNIAFLIFSVLVTRHVDCMVTADIRILLGAIDNQDYSLARGGSNVTFSDYISVENILKKVAKWEKEDLAKNGSAKVDNETTKKTTAREPMSEAGNMEEVERTGDVVVSTTNVEESVTDIVGSVIDSLGSTTDIVGSVIDSLGSTTDIVGSTTDSLGSTTDSLGSTTESGRNNIDVVRSTTEMGKIIDIDGTTEIERTINVLASTTDVKQITEVGSTTETGIISDIFRSTTDVSGSITDTVGIAIDVENTDNNTNKEDQQNNETGVECTCTDFINDIGYGQCKKGDELFGWSPICYAKLPSSCNDLKPSRNSPGKLLSALACSSYECTCTDFINDFGYGQCKKGDELLGRSPICYVKLPSGCKDLKPSRHSPGKFISALACSVYGCPEENIDYFNNEKNDIVKFKEAKSVDSWQACSDMCRTQFTECKSWTWVKSGKCLLKTNNEGRRENNHTISGSQECGANVQGKESVGKINNKNQSESAECSALQGKIKTKFVWNCNQDGSYSCSTTITDCSDCKNIGTITRGEKFMDKDGNVSQEGQGGWECGDQCRNSSRGHKTQTEVKQCEHEYL